MTRAWFLTMCLMAMLEACATPENATVDASRPPQTSAGDRKGATVPAETPSSEASDPKKTPPGESADSEGRAACLRKGSVVEAWSCAFKD